VHLVSTLISASTKLESILAGYDGLLVAFSGGVDSGVLLAVASRILGDRVIALTTDSASMPRAELQDAIAFAKTLGVRHIVAASEELERPEYARNDRDRCYFCKHTLFQICESIAAREGMATIAYGYTADDAGDFRPGHRAAREFQVAAPLFEARLGKSEIRAIARDMGLSLADKPAAPCLSSRIPYGSEVTPEKLRGIESMEELLHELGFRICRARYDGILMRIELEPRDIARAVEPAIRERILSRAREAGIGLVSLDLEGFRSGKLNEI
jgi:pyridinium-3,5-biscarboxylic acid mononucleotide sulfurtransferase